VKGSGVIGTANDFQDVQRLSSISERVSEVKEGKVEAGEVLAELYALLEEYGPAWYTQQHHARALAALNSLKRC
jgi:hypothetical protein